MTKKQLSDLAILGGTPAFSDPLHVGRPNIGDPEVFFDYMRDIFGRRWFTNNGFYVQALEEKIATLLGVKYCFLICNGTIAQQILVHSLGLTGEVIIPSFTFVATAHALQWQGLTPVFCDIDPQTHNIDPSLIPQLITERTRAILGVHVWGRACDIQRLQILAEYYHLPLLFDAAHAFGVSWQQQPVGGFGRAEIFSFHATKVFNTFEGGAITTNEPELAEAIQLTRNFGFSGYDQVTRLGTNGKMTEVSAAMGLAMLAKLPDILQINQHHYHFYETALEEMMGIELVKYNLIESNNFQYIVAEIDEAITGFSRDLLVDCLKAENILARRYFYPGCHQVPPYLGQTVHQPLPLSNTESLVQRVMTFPTGTGVTTQNIEQVIDLVRFIYQHAPTLQAALQQKT